MSEHNESAADESSNDEQDAIAPPTCCGGTGTCLGDELVPDHQESSLRTAVGRVTENYSAYRTTFSTHSGRPVAALEMALRVINMKAYAYQIASGYRSSFFSTQHRAQMAMCALPAPIQSQGHPRAHLAASDMLRSLMTTQSMSVFTNPRHHWVSKGYAHYRNCI